MDRTSTFQFFRPVVPASARPCAWRRGFREELGWIWNQSSRLRSSLDPARAGGGKTETSRPFYPVLKGDFWRVRLLWLCFRHESCRSNLAGSNLGQTTLQTTLSSQKYLVLFFLPSNFSYFRPTYAGESLGRWISSGEIAKRVSMKSIEPFLTRRTFASKFAFRFTRECNS